MSESISVDGVCSRRNRSALAAAPAPAAAPRLECLGRVFRENNCQETDVRCGPCNMSVGKAIGWSSGACALFGLQNYLIGATNSMPKDDFCRTVGLLWLSTGTCGVALLLRRPSRGVFYCDSHEHGGPPQRIGCIPKLATLSGGLALATAALFMKLSFAADPDAQGPLCSVVCADVILVSLLCHFFYDERLSRAQWLSVAAVFAGLVAMAGPFGQTGAVSLRGLTLAVGAMVSFGASVFSVRIASAGNLAASSGFIARALVMGKAAVPLLLRASWDGADRISIGLPLICGLLQVRTSGA